MRCSRNMICILAIGAAIGCGDGRSPRALIADVSANVAEFAAAATGQKAVMADEVKNAGHLGFDTGTYPGDHAMLAWSPG